MQVQSVNNKYNQSFGIRFKLSSKTIKALEFHTGLDYDEMTRLSLDESAKLMKERGKLKEPSKLRLWFSDKYRKFGEKYGLLEKHHNFYTED